MGIVEAIIAAIAVVAAAGITAGSSASASEDLRGGQREAASIANREAVAAERTKQLEYGLSKQSLELEKLGIQEKAKKSKREEERALRTEKRQNMASFYAKTNNFLNDELGRNDRLSRVWG